MVLFSVNRKIAYRFRSGLLNNLIIFLNVPVQNKNLKDKINVEKCLQASDVQNLWK
jgi:hypothetical protein